MQRLASTSSLRGHLRACHALAFVATGTARGSPRCGARRDIRCASDYAHLEEVVHVVLQAFLGEICGHMPSARGHGSLPSIVARNQLVKGCRKGRRTAGHHEGRNRRTAAVSQATRLIIMRRAKPGSAVLRGYQGHAALREEGEWGAATSAVPVGQSLSTLTCIAKTFLVFTPDATVEGETKTRARSSSSLTSLLGRWPYLRRKSRGLS